MFELLGYASAIAIGIALGLIGGGGSILTVPALVYLMGIPPVLATAYSLFVVGSSAMVGGVRFAQKGLVDFKIALQFGLPGIVAVYATRKFIIPSIPDQITEIASFAISKDMMLMMLFALLMVASSVGMISKPRQVAKEKRKVGKREATLLIIAEGLLVGTLTGLVGAGGGFLIIPALVLLAGLEMKRAIGTSLFIIAAKSLIGFLGDATNYQMDWKLLIIFSLLAIGGIFIGSFFSTKIDSKKLKTGFGWFVLIMGLFIIVAELSA